MRRVPIALALLALIIFGCFWSNSAIERTVADIVSDIESGSVGAAYEKWNTAQSLLGALLMHEELDQADKLFFRLLEAEKIQDDTEYTLTRRELVGQLMHLLELDSPSIKNLL